ncbi:MAG: RimK/LysX family protein [Planctomycetota bacterium]
MPPDSPTHAAAHTAGWHEIVAFPDWGVKAVRAKLDTGAKTSAVHAENITELPPSNDGTQRVRFDLVLRNKPPHRVRTIEADLVRTTAVKSSNGQLDTRYVVATTLVMGPVAFPAEFTLVSRSDMRFRVLLGRRALAEGILVDSSREYLLTDPPRKRKTTANPTADRS